MARTPFRFVTPDTRLRHIQFARDQEEERKTRLDEMDARRQMQIDQQMQRETQRKAELDQRDSIQEQTRFEQARSTELDKREAQEAERTRQSATTSPAHYTQRELGARAQSFGVSTPEYLAAPQGAKEEAAGYVAGVPTTPMENLRQRVYEKYSEYLDVNLATLERQNQRRTALDLPTFTEEDMEERAWQRAVADVTAPAPGAAEFLGKGALLTAELAGGLASEGLRNIAGVEAQTFIPEALRGGEVSPGGVVPPFLVPPMLQQDVSREPPTETLERLPRSAQLGLEAAAFAPFFGPGLAAEIGVGSIVGGEIGERTPIGREVGEAAGFLGGPAVSRGILGPAARGLTTRAPTVTKPMTQADIMGGRADIAGTTAADIPAGAKGTPGEMSVLVERAGLRAGGVPPKPFAATDPGIAGGALTRLTNIVKQTKPLRGEAEEYKSEKLRQKVAALRGVQAGQGGEAGFKAGMATLRGTNLPAKGEGLAQDTMVWAKDRNNIGRIVSLSDDGVTAEVSFYNRKTGAAATKTMDTSLLTPFGGEVRWQFTQPEIDALVNHPLGHPAAKARPLEVQNAQAALLDTLSGSLPTKGQIELLEKYYGSEFAKAVWSNRTLGAKAWQSFVDVINLPKTIMASIDNSFPLRQGVMTMPRHPKEWFGNLPESFRSGFSANRARFINDALKADETVIQTQFGPRTVSELAEEGGLFRATIEGVSMTEREEFFMSNLAKRIPILGAGVRWSERAFATYGNKLRHDIFKNTLLSWQSHGENVDLKAVKALANLLNRLTGRGTLGPLNEIAPALNAGFFAPRFAASRPQAFLQLFNWQNPKVARMAAGEIISFVALGTSILSLVELSGAADVELDPRSANFGKIKIGNTRIDFWGGNIQWARLVAQLQQGKRKTSDGIVVDSSRIESALRFARTKGSPPGGTTADLALGETMIGERFPPSGLGFGGEGDITTEVFRRTAPMAIQDLVEAIVEHGMTGFLFGAPAFGGVGVQTYETKQEAFERVTGQKWSETPGFRRRELIAASPELQLFESEEPTTGEEIRQERGAELLPFAQPVLAGVPGAARNYHESRSNTMAHFAGVSENEFKDMDIPIVGKDMEVLDKYYTVDFQIDRDGDGLPGGDEDVRLALEEQDALFEQLSPDVQKAMKNPANFFPQEEVQEVEGRRTTAQDKLDYLFDNIPKYQGGTVEYCEKVDDYVRYVRQEWKDASREYGDRLGWSQPDAAIELGRQEGKKDLGYDAALVISQDATWNPEYNDYLIANQAAIAPFFPGMYQRTIFREPGVLTDEVWAEVNVPIPSPTERQEMQQAAGMERFREVEQAQQPLVR